MRFLQRSAGTRVADLAFLSVVLMTAMGHAQTYKSYANTKQVRIDLETHDDLVALERTGVIILDCIPHAGKTYAIVTDEQLAAVERIGRPVQVVVEDVQAVVEREHATWTAADPFTDFFLDYHPYGSEVEIGTIVWYMNELVARYPTLASMVNVGTTLEGRTIWGLRVSGDAAADLPAVVYFGAEHSREWITTTVPNFFATHLLENYGGDPAVTDLVDHVEFLLIPVFNVDGYLYTWSTDRYWRKNRRNNGDGTYGVDINRNWSVGWGLDVGSSGNPDSSTYRGTAPFSEPETQALRDFFYAHPNVRAQLDIHSFSQLILWPYGHTPELPADQPTYEEIGYGMQSLIYDVHGQSYAAGSIYGGIYPVSGDSLDWTYDELGILSFSYECRDTGQYGFALPPDQIIPNNEELLPAMLYLTDSDWVRAAIRLELPSGAPSILAAGSDTVIPVNAVSQTETIVPGSVRMYYRYDASGPFNEVVLSSADGESYEATLPATNCLSQPEFYFVAEGDGGAMATRPDGAPGFSVYAASVETGAVPFHDEDLSVNPRWTTEGQWAWGTPTGGGGQYGGPDPTSGHTGSTVYGYNLGGDYPNGMGESHLTSAPIDCTGRFGVRLSFWRWLGVETPAYDHADVRVSNDGTSWTTVWANDSEVADTSWTQQTYDIAGVADNQPTVYLRWTMGSSDGGWQFCGWNVDDIELTSATCDSVIGDYNGDGVLDAVDYAWLESCYSGTDVLLSSGCAIFDADADVDVDCGDWSVFEAGWTGPDPAPTFAICSPFNAPVADDVAKNRYLSFTPGSSLGQPQAFRITTLANPVFPATEGQQRWVGQPDADGICRFECAPVFAQWEDGLLDVADLDVVPGATYAVEATLDGVSFLDPVYLDTVPVKGDVVGVFEDGVWTPSNGTVDVLDFVAGLERFSGLPTAPPMSWCDTYPDLPDGVLDIVDVVFVIDSFEGAPYPFGAPASCP